MSNTKVCTVYDELARRAGPLFEAPNDAVALRSYRRLMEDNPRMSKDEFRLYCVAEWDPGTMHMVLVSSYLIPDTEEVKHDITE